MLGKEMAVRIAGIALLVGSVAGAARADDALCEDPGAFCALRMSAECLARTGAGALSAASADEGGQEGDCAEQLRAYRDCVASATGCAPPAAETAGCTEAIALALWSSAEKDDSCAGYRTFGEVCPQNPLARFASTRMIALGCAPPFEAFGVMLEPSPEGGFTIIAIDAEGPAAQEDLRVSDRVVEVNQRPVSTRAELDHLVELGKRDGRPSILLRIERSDGLKYVAIPYSR